MPHPKIAAVALNLADAKATFDYKVIQAQGALRSVVGDGTGDKDDLAAAKAVAKEYGFELSLHPAAPEPVKPRAAKPAK